MKTQQQRDCPPGAAVPMSSERALSELASSCAHRGFLIGCDLLGSRAEAEDAVQEALARACKSWHRLRDTSSLHAWFYRVLTNICMRSLRRRRLRRTLMGAWLREDVPQSEPQLDEQIDLEQRIRTVMTVLDSLPDKQRTALILRYGHRLSVAEVASMLGVETATAKTHLARGMRRLRTRLVPSLEATE